MLLMCQDYKKTQKLTWLSDVADSAPLVSAVCVHFDHIITKPVLAKTDDFKQFINKDSRVSPKLYIGKDNKLSLNWVP